MCDRVQESLCFVSWRFKWLLRVVMCTSVERCWTQKKRKSIKLQYKEQILPEKKNFKLSQQKKDKKKVPRLKYTYAYVEMSGFKNEARKLSKQIVAFM